MRRQAPKPPDHEGPENRNANHCSVKLLGAFGIVVDEDDEVAVTEGITLHTGSSLKVLASDDQLPAPIILLYAVDAPVTPWLTA